MPDLKNSRGLQFLTDTCQDGVEESVLYLAAVGESLAVGSGQQAQSKLARNRRGDYG